MTERDTHGNILSTAAINARDHARAARANTLTAYRIAREARDAALATGATEAAAEAAGKAAAERWWNE
jgi:hypothetical protein